MAPISASDYYEKMISIEKEKLEVIKKTLEIKKWYMEQKIALLREKHPPVPQQKQQLQSPQQSVWNSYAYGQPY